MHPHAFEFVQKMRRMMGPGTGCVVEAGSYDVNGSVRSLFGGWDYTGVDILEGPGVDVVSPFEDWTTEWLFDCVVSTEALEHTANAPLIVHKASQLLVKGGVFIMTCAAPGRPQHSWNGGGLQEGEFYRNVSTEEFRSWAGPYFDVVLTDEFTWPTDLYAFCVR